ncbi:unnamed protein product [Sphagnum troendelagicum]|uniref:Coenzyme Q-binding protein COQ10 START domain-containing protein n=1 Tax=Sphagnum troendelagicum TaxID=128251 RepID=A0ABP0TYP8_9BRYO
MESIISRVVVTPSQFPELYNNRSGGRGGHLFALSRLQTIAKLDSSNVPYSSSRLRMPKQKKNLRFGSQSKHSHRSSSPFLCGGIRVVGLRESSGYLGQVFGAHSYNGSKWIASTWLDNTVQVEADVPLSEAWELWNDRENVTQWMPWITSVKVLKDKPEMSKWTLRYEAFGQEFEFSWLSRNLKPIHHQKIHWRSVDGVPNRGAVRFYPRGAKACGVQLTISYEVPDVLAPFASGVSPLVESILQQDLNRFAKFAKSNYLKSGKM